MAQTAARPETVEYHEYYHRYVQLVPDGNVVDTLERQLAETLELLGSISEEQAAHRYAEGKWSIKELVGHIADTERIFAYRALRIGRGDKTPLPGFEQDDYVPQGGFDGRTLVDIADEFANVRRATLSLFRSFPAEAWVRTGTASERPISVRAIAYITAGHELAHKAILRERYL